jgi:hypothetical protein
MLLTSMFWTRDEQPLRMAFWLGCNGISTIVGSGISWGLGHTNNATLHPWQLVFVVSPPVCSEEKVKIVLTTRPGDWSSKILFRYSFGVHSPVNPGSCIFFSRPEALASVWRVSYSRTEVKHGKILWYQVCEAFTDLKIYFIFASAICLGIINGVRRIFGRRS